ncbi:hypothetical protein F7C95_06630 [Opitutia bacterium ISCC 51]|nr:hypothetical protein F7C95_06630 [Opitutae bacterium ISCC 51]QXD29635.1 hypothetical protein GA003_06595 [Opitutae bacterium ISCC 52]
MRPIPFLIILLACGALCAKAVAQTANHDFYVCAAVNKNYVIGSKIVTTSGIHLQTESGEWQHVGINDPSIFQVSFDPRDHNVFYTAALNGALRTLDGGENWRILTSWDITEPKDICVDPFNPDTVYLAHPGGIAASFDQGMTWSPIEKGLPDRGKYTQTIETDRSREGRILAGCESGIYMTTNGGKSWRRVLKTKETVNDLQQSPHNPDTWAAVTQGDAAWASIDGGKTWKQFPDVPGDAALYNITFDATDPKRLAIGSYTYGMMTSEDRGGSWTYRNEGLPDPHRVWRVGVHPDTGRLYASVYQNALYASGDFGRTWQREGLEGSAINSFVFLKKGGANDAK